MKIRTINLSLPVELVEKIDRVAKNEFRNRSELFREVLRRYIEDQEFDSLTKSLRKQAKDQDFTVADVDRFINEYRSGK